LLGVDGGDDEITTDDVGEGNGIAAEGFEFDEGDVGGEEATVLGSSPRRTEVHIANDDDMECKL